MGASPDVRTVPVDVLKMLPVLKATGENNGLHYDLQ